MLVYQGLGSMVHFTKMELSKNIQEYKNTKYSPITLKLPSDNHKNIYIIQNHCVEGGGKTKSTRHMGSQFSINLNMLIPSCIINKTKVSTPLHQLC